MKFSVYRVIFAFSLVVCASICFSISATTVNLGPGDNYKGGIGSDFSKTTSDSNGTIYNFIGDFSVTSVGVTTVATTSCFSNTAGDLTFLGNGYKFSFTNLRSSNSGAAVNATKPEKSVTFSRFSLLSFIMAPLQATNKGSIYTTGSLIFGNNTTILFEQNMSAEDGGAINVAKTLSLTDTRKSIVFNQNQSSKKGGAISAQGAVTITSNLGLLMFNNNSAAKAGGALNAEGSVTISDNVEVVFSNNTITGTDATDSGGAICCNHTTGDPILTITGNKKLSFLQNSATTSGGAIYAKKLILSSKGPVRFTGNLVRNATPKGGAISIAADGEISLSADTGSIIFDNNSVITSGDSPTTTRNAIDVGSNGKFLKLRASAGNSIIFYDPVTCAGTGTPALNINQADSGKDYTGSIVFSGETLSQESSAVDRTSTFTQDLNLAAGSLVLKSGVTLKGKSIKQTQGSRVIMDAGTTLEATAENVTLTNLTINLASLKATQPAIIKASGTNKPVSLTGPVLLADEKGNFYENHELVSSHAFSAIQLIPSGTGVVTLNQVNVPEPEAHYGYQGNWSLTWADATEKSKVATLTWSKTGYRPNPERQGSLVLNSLWSAHIDTRSLMQLLETSADSLRSSRGFWIGGLANFFHKDRTGTQRGFRHISGGYVLGASAETFSDELFTVAFSQLFGKDKDYLVAKNNERFYAGSFFYQRTAFLNRGLFIKTDKGNTRLRFFPHLSGNAPVILEAQCTYSHVNNNMKTRYTEYPGVSSRWGNNCFALECGGSLPIYLFENGRLFQGITPFIKTQFIYAHQGSFREKGSEGRAFTPSNLTCVSLPVGMKFEKLSKTEASAYDVSVIYTPDIIRSTPSCETSLIISQESWKTYATNLAHQALTLRGTSYYVFNHYADIFGQAAFEWRSSSRNYSFSLGSKMQF
ncbi:polymorphic outer membrane protein middle domain-containing protein [Candidatus Chlamydia sanziniae]|uniref:Outer membrane protein 5 n=1 Tax=Candidatus Chlamydia sanziniae TaxID=1806891 RepID=A0A1A9HXS9_9CHLA|nr:polymorphic outer membrane protein middle domain-containing protein [Candidatus Chlamydia sanziniae]ANH78844.1 outer membrane protein 5 [Candidatus Chlamydia sanziniae]